MPVQKITFRCLLISPGDVQQERDAIEAAITEWNAHVGRGRQVAVEVVRWESHGRPDMSAPAQDVLNRQIVDDCDFGVAIFWGRLGSPTRTHASGSEEEVERLLARHANVMVYFSTAPIPQARLGDDQFGKLQERRKSYEQRGLVTTYDTIPELTKKVVLHLTSLVTDLLKPPAAEAGFLELMNSTDPAVAACKAVLVAKYNAEKKPPDQLFRRVGAVLQAATDSGLATLLDVTGAYVHAVVGATSGLRVLLRSTRRPDVTDTFWVSAHDPTAGGTRLSAQIPVTDDFGDCTRALMNNGVGSPWSGLSSSHFKGDPVIAFEATDDSIMKLLDACLRTAREQAVQPGVPLIPPSVRAQFTGFLVPDVLEEIRRLRAEVVELQMVKAGATQHAPSLAAMIRVILPAPLWFSLNLFNTGKQAAVRPGVLVRSRPPNSLFSWPLDDPDKARFFGSEAPAEKLMYQATDEVVIHPTMGKKVVDVRTTFFPPPGFAMHVAVTIFAMDIDPVEVEGTIAVYGSDKLLFMPASADPRPERREPAVVETVTIDSTDAPRDGRPESVDYDPSVVAARALNRVLTPTINSMIGEASRSGRMPRLVVVDTESCRPLPLDWKLPIGVIQEDEMVLVGAPLPPDVRPGFALLVVRRPAQ